MDLDGKLGSLVVEIESQLKKYLRSLTFGRSAELREMISYHMGWEDDLGGGKRLRPVLTLLCAGACGGDHARAMPAALGIEFFHNFTLIHDDIQDGSTTRHGHPTVWTRWGVPQAINAGDTLLSIAQQALLGLDATCGSVVAVRAAQELNQVCLRLTRGQYLDMAFEKEEEVELETYLDMIRDKTAELLAFSTGVGGLAAGAGDTVIRQLSVYGENLGMAFQVQDDLLGIWGDPAVTGKSAAGDLLARKKTLPILFGLRESEAFRALWRVENPEPEQVTAMADLLQACGAQAYVRAEAAEFTRQAFDALAELFSGGNADADALKALTEGLLHRQM